MLKPALARGELRCVGATTLTSTRSTLKKTRRWNAVPTDLCGEPSVEDTIAILRGLKEKYEVHHGVRIKDSAIVAAATLSHRYITDRFLPDKAIDLIDEAASRLRIEIDSLPQEIDQLEREILQLEIERQALQREEDERSKARLWEIEQRIADLREKSSGMKAKWQSEKRPLSACALPRWSSSNSSCNSIQVEMPVTWRARRNFNMAKYRIGTSLSGGTTEAGGVSKRRRDAQGEVDEEDVAEVVAKWTGIPVSKMLEGEMQKLVSMEARLGKRVIGQEEALKAVADAVRRARAGLQDPNRPVGSFIFLGQPALEKQRRRAPWLSSCLMTSTQ